MSVPYGYHFILETADVLYPYVHPDPTMYNWSDVSEWTQRQTLGGLTIQSLDQQAAIEQRSWHGGMGQLEMKELSAYRIADKVQTLQAGHAVLRPLTQSVDTTPDGGGPYAAGYGVFDSTHLVLVVSDNKAEVFRGLLATSTDISTGLSGDTLSVFNNGKYFFVGRVNDSVMRLGGTIAAPTWTEISASSTNHPRDVTAWAVHDGYVWTNQTTNSTCNLIHYAGQDDLADLEGNTSANVDHTHYDAGGDALAIEVGPEGRSVKKLVVFDQQLYAFRTDGIWVISRADRDDPDGYSATKLFDYTGDVDGRNFDVVQYWNGALWFNVRDRIFRYTGTGQVELSVQPYDFTYPPVRDAYPITMCASRDYLYAIMAQNDDDEIYSLYAFNGSTWHCLRRDIPGNGQDGVLLNYPTTEYGGRLLCFVTEWHPGSDLRIYYWDDSEYPISFELTGYLHLSRIDGGFLHIDKKWDYINLLFNCPEETSIEVRAYSFNDGDIEEYNLGTITSDYADSTVTIGSEVIWNRSVARLKFPRQAYGKELEIRITLNASSDGSETPVLYGMLLTYILRPPTIYGYAVQVIMSENQPTLSGNSDRKLTVRDRLAILEDARDSKTPLYFEDFLGHAAYVYPSAIRGEVVKINPTSSGGIAEDYEVHVTMSLIEIEKDTCQEVSLTDGTIITGRYTIPCTLIIEGTVSFVP